MNNNNKANNGISKADTSQIPVDYLEEIRNRLNQVHLSLRRLADQISHNRQINKSKIPNYSHIQNQLQVLLTQLHSISNNLDNNGNILKNTNVYPLPNFPTSQHEGLLTTLLRKKPLPEVERWIQEAIDLGKSDCYSIEKEDELTRWIMAKIEELREEFQFYGFESIEELNHLQSEEGQKEQEEKKIEEQKMKQEELRITDGGKQGLHPNTVLKFMYRGILT